MTVVPGGFFQNVRKNPSQVPLVSVPVRTYGQIIEGAGE